MNRRLPFSTIAVLIIVFVVTGVVIPLTPVQAAAGDLDPTFGDGGKTINLSFVAGALALQQDGRIVAVGTVVASPNAGHFAVARFTSNGDIDTTFGIGGLVLTAFGSSSQCFAVAVQPDGKLVVGGYTFALGGAVFALARYNVDGTLDSSFGSAGKVTTRLNGDDDTIYALAVQTDGKIIAVGSNSSHTTQYDFALARYNPDGTLDTSFGNGGKVTTNFFSDDEAFAVALQADGKIVAVGEASAPSPTSTTFALARYNVDGSLDSTFGIGGKTTTNFFSRPSQASAVRIQRDGKIVAAGTTVKLPPHMDSDFALVRYNIDGTLDHGFGDDGKVLTDLNNGSSDRIFELLLQPDDKIIGVGSAFFGDSARGLAGDFALARYLPNGGLDTSFGSGGKITTDFFGHRDEAYSAVLQPDGKIVAGGFIYHPIYGSGTGIVRYNNDPPFDLCIQDESNGNLLQVNTTTGEYQFTNCAGLTIGGTGILTKRGNQLTLQHNSTDRRVMASVDTSSKRATASIQLLSQGRTFSITDRNITNNTCACR